MKFFLGALFMFSLFKHTDYRKKNNFVFSINSFFKQPIKLLQFNLFSYA